MNLSTNAYASDGLTSRTLPPLDVPGFFNYTDPAASIATIIGAFIALAYIFGGLWAFVMIIRGGYGIISSSGDKQQMHDGRNKITFGILGLVVLFASWGIMVLIEQMAGICLGFSCPVNLYSIAPV